MKKFILVVLAALMVVVTPAEAKKWGHGHHHGRKGCCYSRNVTAGILGATTGILLAKELARPARPVISKPVVHIVEPESNCYTIVSKKTGKVRQECFENESEKVIYVD